MYLAILSGVSGNQSTRRRSLSAIIRNDDDIVSELSLTTGQFSLKSGTYRFQMWTVDGVASNETTARTVTRRESVRSYLYNESTLIEVTGAYASNTFPNVNSASAAGAISRYAYYQQTKGWGVFEALQSSVFSLKYDIISMQLSGTSSWGGFGAPGVFQTQNTGTQVNIDYDTQPGTVLELEKVA